MRETVEKKLMKQIDEVICHYRTIGFPCAHKDRPGVIKVIETSGYHLEFDFACKQINGVGNGVGLCLYIPEASKCDYRDYFEKRIRNSELADLAVVEYGKKETNRRHGVVVKCWLKEVDWRKDDFDSYRDRLFQLFDRFHSALAELVTIDDVRERYLYWAMDQRLKDARQERCAWTVVREDLNRQLEKAIGGQVGALAVVKNLNYLDLERTLDQYGLLDDAVENWLDDEHVVPLRSVDSSNVAEIKKTLIANAQISLFNAFFKDRKSCFDKVSEVNDEISRMHATDYLVKMLARSQHGKKYENYVVTGIWNRVVAACKREGVTCPRIVTQQLVRRSGDHRHALIDLYFPETKLAVECDEAQHQGNIVEDALREADIEASGLIKDRSDIRRVDATGSYVDMDCEMDEIAAEVMRRVLKAGKIGGLRAPVDMARSNGKLAVDDGLLYQSKAETLAALGIRKWKNGPACSSFLDSLYDREGRCWRVLFLDVDKKNEGKGWQRKAMSDDLAVTKNKNALQKGFAECLPEDNVIVFVAEPNNCGYSFAGTYKLDGDILRQSSSHAPLFGEMFNKH